MGDYRKGGNGGTDIVYQLIGYLIGLETPKNRLCKIFNKNFIEIVLPARLFSSEILYDAYMTAPELQTI